MVVVSFMSDPEEKAAVIHQAAEMKPIKNSGEQASLGFFTLNNLRLL